MKSIDLYEGDILRLTEKCSLLYIIIIATGNTKHYFFNGNIKTLFSKYLIIFLTMFAQRKNTLTESIIQLSLDQIQLK